MTPPRVAQRQHSGQDGLTRLHPDLSWEAAPRPGETPSEAAYRAAIDAATAILLAYDDGTAEHSDDVVTLSEAIADRLGVAGADRRHVTAVAALHDIGKVAVDPKIINKPGPLDDLEWQQMRRHTIEGEEILGSVPEIAEVARLVRSCHERYDGTGYPDGLADEQIPLIARIVFCADAFHAIRSDRPYRAGRPAAEAVAELEKNAGTQFDPVVVAALCDVRRQLVGRRKRSVGTLASSARGRRLVVLLAALAVSGSAMAATGAYHHLPGRADAREAPAPADASVAALRTSIFGEGHQTARSVAAGTGATERTGTSASSRTTGQAVGKSRGTGPRGLAHGVRGTAPGQIKAGPGTPATPAITGPKGTDHAAKAPKVKKPKKVKKQKQPKTQGPKQPKARSPQAKQPKAVKAPKVEIPKVKPPKVKPPKVKPPKVKPPKG